MTRRSQYVDDRSALWSASELNNNIGGIAAGGLLVSICLCVLIFLTGLFANNGSVTYLGVAMLAFIIPLTVGLMVRKKFDVFEPVNIIAGAIFFATTMRAPFLIQSGSERAEFLMMGTNFDDVLSQAPWMLAGILAFSIGYILFSARVAIERWDFFSNYHISREKFWSAIIALTVLGTAGILLYFLSFGITLDDGLLALSQKRNNQFMSESGETIYGRGYEAWLGQLSQYAFLLLASALIAGILRLTSWRLGLTIGLFFLSCVMPFLISSRNSIAILVIIVVIFAYYYNRLTLRQVFIVGSILMVVLTSLGALRELNQRGAVERSSVVEQIIGSGNGIDLVRTSAIMDRVPAVKDYLSGSSYLALGTAFVPRAVWPDKPNPALGTWVKGELFNEPVQNNGWPSGMIAEGFVNFGYLGLILAMFLYGVLLRYFYESFQPLLGISWPATVVYAVAIWRITFSTIGLNFAHGVIQTLQYVIPTLLILIFVRIASKKFRNI